MSDNVQTLAEVRELLDRIAAWEATRDATIATLQADAEHTGDYARLDAVAADYGEHAQDLLSNLAALARKLLP